MSFLASRLFATARGGVANQLATSFRALSVTPSALRKVEPVITPVPLKDPIQDKAECKSVFEKVNGLLASQKEGRLFAIVHLCGKQFKVTEGDIILVEGYWPPTAGDQIRLEKVLVAGGDDFTLFGRPIVDSNLVDVQATIIEKTLTHTKTHFKKRRRKQYMRINFYRSPNTMIRINSITVHNKINEPVPEENVVNLF